MHRIEALQVNIEKAAGKVLEIDDNNVGIYSIILCIHTQDTLRENSMV